MHTIDMVRVGKKDIYRFGFVHLSGIIFRSNSGQLMLFCLPSWSRSKDDFVRMISITRLGYVQELLSD